MSSTAVVTRASRYGRFRPYRLRATGGFSDVYLARDNTGMTAALKVFRSMSSDTSRSMERFRREKLILERVGSRRVARLIDADLDAVPPWIASEFVDGPTLREAVSQAGSFGIELSASVLSLLSETLAEIHDLGIAHRDLNPNNIILSSNGPTLIDFGSAQLLATGQANFSQLSVGTPGYISPEQLNGEPATLASDIYSFGKIASFLVTGDATDQGRRGLALFPPSQEEILRCCLSEDPLKRPSARDLQAAFASRENPVAEIQKLDYQAPELRKIPRGRTSALFLFLGVCVLTIGSIGVWRVTNTNELGTLDLVNRLAESHKKYGKSAAEILTRSNDFGVIEAISLPPDVEMFRERRNFSKKDFGFLDFFRLYREDAISSELVVYALPSVDPPSYKELVGSETTSRLADLPGFGAGISDRVAQFQSEFVYAECALDVPETVLTDAVLGRIRHVAAAPVCLDLLGTTQVAYAIHDWYPDRNLLFELTGWVDISVVNPVQLLSSIELSEGLISPIARPTLSLELSDLSIYRDRPSLIDANDADAAYFYANVFVEIPSLSSLELKISAPEESAAQFSFTAYRRETAGEEIVEFPAGRLWAINEHQIRFDNPDTTPLVLSFEIDSSDTIPPEVLISAVSNAGGEGWLTASTLSLDIGDPSSSLDEELRFMLPSLMDQTTLVTTRSSVGSLEIPVPSMWKPTTDGALAQAGFREFWPIVDTELRESDLPHLQVTTEEFSRQVDGSDGLIWVADTAFLSCRTPTTFVYSNDRTVEWSVFRSCEIPDALQGNFSRQIQASMIIKFVVHDGVKDDGNETAIVYRGVFVPGSHQDLDYLKSLIEYLASGSL
jgi:serine/threonine protein kinase